MANPSPARRAGSKPTGPKRTGAEQSRGARPRRALSLLLLAVGLLAPGATFAQDGDDASLEELVLGASADELVRWGSASVAMDRERTHFDDEGYPEDVEGQLVLKPHSLGPMTVVEGESEGRLLYAQFVNRQRDAVFLARTGTVRDSLPNGSSFEIPYGYGAVKENEVTLSLVEARVVPHVSDNRKSYRLFPTSDLYLGASVGSSGVTASARYVLRETYVGYLRAGLNTFGRLNRRSVLNTYWVPVHLGGGYRFPGLFSSVLGENVMTVSGDLFLGFGDRDSDPATPSAVLLPGAVLELERLLYDTASSREDFRTDPRPYNYRVNSISLRIGAYLDVPTASQGGSLVRLTAAAGFQFNLIGPRIPDHEFKSTEVRYVHQYYVEDLQRQAERRAERNTTSEERTAR